MPEQRILALRTKSELGLNSIQALYNTEIAMCACICSGGDVKGVRERERDREMVHAQTYLTLAKEPSKIIHGHRPGRL